MILAQRSAPRLSMRWFFFFFFVSGFCSLLYEVVWLRLAMAKFGVTSPLLSIVLSMFMAGLGLGSWLSGRAIRHFGNKLDRHALSLYALAELLIGASALLVPVELAWGRHVLAQFSLSSSASYYFASGVWIGLTLIPWCACMGATIPFAMLAIQTGIPNQAQRSFSFLYLANVLGACLGALGPSLFVELYGFRGTLKIGAALNALLAASALTLASRLEARAGETHDSQPLVSSRPDRHRRLLALLFLTGCTSMGAEVVWVRQFTPYTGTVVYAFASLLALYLISTYAGSQLYRRWGAARAEAVWPVMCGGLALGCVLAAITSDPQLHLPRFLRLLLGIAPLSALMGFATPMLVDRWSAGDPDKAGSAYAVNVLGCIAGPLLAGFLLLPYFAERWVLLVFSFPWLLLAVSPWNLLEEIQPVRWRQRLTSGALVLASLFVVFVARGYEGKFAQYDVLRDDTATVIATGSGMDKRLLVNGIGITKLTPTTKIMAHLPLAFLPRPPQNALAICFGMGTSYRSLMSWNIQTTAVELVPSVPQLFGYFESDASALTHSPRSRIVIDDGRAFLERTAEQFDVITIDPPPPVEAAGSSLLYSKEFYATIRRRLRPGGILQQWLPKDDNYLQSSIGRALAESFPYVRVFGPLEGTGLHYLASNDPLLEPSAEELAARLPASAARDLVEWGPGTTPVENFALVLNKEHAIDDIVARDPHAPALTDDHPVNEFYGLRRYVRPALAQIWNRMQGRR